MRKRRQNNQKQRRDGKVHKLHKDPGLPQFGEEKRKLERRVGFCLLVVIDVEPADEGTSPKRHGGGDGSEEEQWHFCNDAVVLLMR